MANKKIIAIAKIERDALNFFFVKMKYGFICSQNEVRTVYEIEDEELIDKLNDLSYTSLTMFRCTRDFGQTILVYDIQSKCCLNGMDVSCCSKPNRKRIIVGTKSMVDLGEINYLVRMISYTMEKEDLGEFFVQYNEEVMTEREFYEFQGNLSIYTV